MKALMWWRAYWFRPAPLLNLAMCRIVLVSYELQEWIHWDMPRHCSFLSTMPDTLYDPLPVLRLLTLPWGGRPSLEVILFVYSVTLAAGCLALVGLFTRLGLVVFAVGSLFIQAYVYSFHELHHQHGALLIAYAILAMSPAGAMWSIDRAWRKRPAPQQTDSPSARWPLLLIQWVVALVYFTAAFEKLRAAGLDWTDGYTLRYWVLFKAGNLQLPLGLWIAKQHGLAVVLSWIVILFQSTFFFVLIWPRLRWVYLPIGIAFHVTAFLAMGDEFFTFIMLYAAFIPWSQIPQVLRRLRPRRLRTRVT